MSSEPGPNGAPTPDDVAADSFTDFKRKQALPKWPLAVGGLVVVVAVAAYVMVTQRGLHIPPGPGHVLRLEGDPEAWLFLRDGNLAKATAASTARFALKTGPCERLGGLVEGELIELEEANCQPGPLRKSVGERLRQAGMKYGYWDPAITSQGDDPEKFLHTPEIVAAMSHTRFQDPQLVALYWELFPGTIARARAELGDRLPPPVVLTVDRNDFQLKRFSRPRLKEFLSYPRYILAGAASQGGWLVREAIIDPAGAEDFESFLAYAKRPPFDTLLAQPSPIRIALRRTLRAPPPSTDGGEPSRPPPPGTVP